MTSLLNEMLDAHFLGMSPLSVYSSNGEVPVIVEPVKAAKDFNTGLPEVVSADVEIPEPEKREPTMEELQALQDRKRAELKNWKPNKKKRKQGCLSQMAHEAGTCSC